MPIKILINSRLSDKAAGRVGEAGFTLVEVMIALAITSVLMAGILAGQGQLRRRVQFSDAVETAKNTMMKIKNEANSTVNGGGGLDGTNPNQVFFAKRVNFWPNSDIMWVDTLVIDSSNNISVLGGGSAYPVTLPWGVRYRNTNSVGAASTSRKVMFVRWPPNGKLYVFTPNLVGFNDTNFSSYNPTDMANRDLKLYQLEDQDNRLRAALQIEGATGTVGRVFN